MLKVFCVFAFSFLLITLKIPILIKLSDWFQLYDKADKHRKRKVRNISRLGGLAIFSGFLACAFSFLNITEIEIRVLIIATTILATVGLMDDGLGGIAVIWKLLAHIAVALFLVLIGGYRITSLYGLFNIYDLSTANSVLTSSLLVIFIINSFNLIDGIDGLAATIGLLASILYGVFFSISGQDQSALLAFTFAGLTAGFLIYNHSPAKVFMGDTGSTIMGMAMASMAINFINLHKINNNISFKPDTSVVVSLAILIIPTFDTLRIFFIRLAKGKSPFRGDMNHVHHRLGVLGMSDGQIVGILVSINISMIAVSLVIRHQSQLISLFILFGAVIFLNTVLTLLVRKTTRSTQKAGLKPSVH